LVETAKREGMIDSEDVNLITSEIKNLFNIKELAFLWDPKYTVKNEVEILNKFGETVRPDKLLIHGSEVIVVDFKTVESKKNHDPQMLKYRSALLELGFQKVESYILYTDSGKLSPVLLDLA